MAAQFNLVQESLSARRAVPAGERSAPTVAPWERFSVKLRRLRRRRGLTLEQVAHALDVSKPTVWAWENGKCRPLPNRMAAIAEVLGADVAELHEISSPDGPDEVIEICRQRIAAAYQVSSASVRILVEL